MSSPFLLYFQPMTDESRVNVSLTALGAGDLIDRAVRLYRNNFWTLVWIAAPPIVLGALFSIGWTILGREVFSLGAASPHRGPEDFFFSWFFTFVGNLIIWLIESVAMLCVMGGASRNFVRHLLFGEPLTFRETYANTFKRIFGLAAASALIVFLLGVTGLFIFYLALVVASFLLVAAAFLLAFSDFLMILALIVLGGACLFGAGWLFFLVASRFVYVPQAMLVEGQGVLAAVGRSASLAGGNVARLYALFIFTVLATYSALALFYVPLGWYAYLNGVEFFSFDPDAVPAWYTIANQVISQASLILLMPIWMVGLCLLYVDERVRHEGYDIELMAARHLGEIPPLSPRFANPLQSALAASSSAAAAAVSLAPHSSPPRREQKSPFTTLGLK
jgi:hypothetical protein